MAQLVDIMAAEKVRTSFSEQREIRLYADGSFYRAYEWSAWLCCRYVKQNKVTRRFVKSVDGDVAYIGFPQTSLSKYVLDGTEVVENADGTVVMRLAESLFPPENERETLLVDFSAWREHQPVTELKTNKKDDGKEPNRAVQPVSSTGIMQQLQAFPIESRTPIECMLFLVEIKQKMAQTT